MKSADPTMTTEYAPPIFNNASSNLSFLKPRHKPSLLPSGKKWQLIWHDEFDGTELDMSKWSYRTHLMQQRYPNFYEGGTALDGNSNLHMKLTEKDGHFFCPHLQTGSNYLDAPGSAYGKFTWPVGKIRQPKFMHRYGYYETRCKLPAQEGWRVAFWLQSPVIGSSLNPAEAGVEVDIMENFKRDNMICQNIHWNGYGEDHQHLGSGDLKLEDTDDGFHTYGVHWSHYGYVFYVDGKETWRVTGPVSHREQFILISTEGWGYRTGDQPCDDLKNAVLPDSFIVDYVRVYDEVPLEQTADEVDPNA